MLWSCFSFITEACNVIRWFGSLQFSVVHVTSVTRFVPVCLVMWQIACEMQKSYLLWQGDSLQGKLATNEFSEFFTLKTTGRMSGIFHGNPYAGLSLNGRPWTSMFISHSLLHVNSLAFSVWQMPFPEGWHRLHQQEGNREIIAFQEKQWKKITLHKLWSALWPELCISCFLPCNTVLWRN